MKLNKIRSLKFRKNQSKRMIGNTIWKGKKHTEETKIKMSQSKKGNKNYNYKTNNLGYDVTHSRIVGEYGKPKYCEICKRTDKKKYEWSNKDHEYKLNIKYWQRLCTSCHRKYDYKNHLCDIGSGGGSIKNKKI